MTFALRTDISGRISARSTTAASIDCTALFLRLVQGNSTISRTFPGNVFHLHHHHFGPHSEYEAQYVRPKHRILRQRDRLCWLWVFLPVARIQGEKALFSGFSRLPDSPGFPVCRSHLAGGKSTLIAYQIPVPAFLCILGFPR